MTCLTNGGAPEPHSHECPASRKGQEMTKDELHMAHGDHWSGLMPAAQLLQNHMKTILAGSKVWRKVRTQVTTESLYEATANVFSLAYGDGGVRIFSILVHNAEDNCNDLVTSYPVCAGKPVEVRVNRVLEWDNQIEATVFCSAGEFEFAFFATDYYCNKDKYVAGQTIVVDLAALAMDAEAADRSMTLEGKEAEELLAKIGEAPRYDDNGNVEPVTINLANMVAFFNDDSQNPDAAEFQSPVVDVKDAGSLLGVDFFRAMITICNQDEQNVAVPLYFRKNFVPDVKSGDPIMGRLWLSGSVAGQHGGCTDDVDDDSCLGKMLADFDYYMHNDCNFEEFDNIMFVINDKLRLLKVRDGYELDAFKCGGNLGCFMQPYCCKKGSKIRYDPSAGVAYDDSMYIQGMIGLGEIFNLPDVLTYFSVPFTKEGIMQAWLLHRLTDFMPRGWHARYGSKSFIAEDGDAECIFSHDNSDAEEIRVREQIQKLDQASLLPHISIYGDKATLECAYWNNWRGLVKMSVPVSKSGSTVVFGQSQEEVLVAYKGGIRF